jgi:hypothetical protein
VSAVELADLIVKLDDMSPVQIRVTVGVLRLMTSNFALPARQRTIARRLLTLIDSLED